MVIKNKLPLIIALISGVLAVILINVYLKQKEKVIEKEKEKIALMSDNRKEVARILVAKRDIPQGTSIQEDMIEEREIPRQFVQPRAAVTLERVINRVASADIAKEEQILFSKLVMPTRESSLAMKTPPGKRAITIPIDNIAAVGGMIRPNDYVDVIGLIPIPSQGADGKQELQTATVSLFQNVLILAVGSSMSASPQIEEAKRYKPEEKGALANTVTLALTPQEASLISFVMEQGKIRLVLRSPTDTQVQPPVLANWDTLLQYLYPELTEKMRVQQGEAVPMEKSRTVEIYRGAQKEIVPLQKSRQ
jgi:pilus assembly protein CpaB